MEAGASAGARTSRFMMEGVGARVIRGPEWKWGKQVRKIHTALSNFKISLCFEKQKHLCWSYQKMIIPN